MEGRKREAERVYTVPELAEHLQVSVFTIRNWLRSGRLRGSQFGRRVGWRVRASEVDRFLREAEPGKDDESHPTDGD